MDDGDKKPEEATPSPPVQEPTQSVLPKKKRRLLIIDVEEVKS